MPVLTVSEKTSPQVGFSRNRWILPSLPVMTTPKARGFSTRVRTMVAFALFCSWNWMAADRSKSVRTSPEMTRNLSLLMRDWQFFTDPAVPRSLSAALYCICTPNSAPSRKYSVMTSDW